jgi:ribosomal protein S18 acetylase RimI-like enzyme
MSERIQIDSVKKNDIDQIISLLVRLRDETGGMDQTDIDTIQNTLEELIDSPSNHMLVARDGTIPIGFVNFLIRKTVLHRSPSGLIDELIISDEYRGKGIGRRLISEVIQRCRNQGCCELEVSTLMSNQKARSFYRECGFNEEAVLLELDLD